MSPYPQYTLKSQDVYKLTLNTLDTLPLTMPGAIPSRDLLRALVFAAASRLSGHQTCDPLECAPSGPTVLGTLSSQCSDLDALEGHINHLLAKLLPKGLGKRGRRVAVAVVALPSHGTVAAAHHAEVCRSKAKGGYHPLLHLRHRLCRGQRPTLYPGPGPRARHTDHGARGPHPPRTFGHLGYPTQTPVARPGLLQCAGEPGPDHSRVALHHASSQTG
jgi:hypothetical protein